MLELDTFWLCDLSADDLPEDPAEPADIREKRLDLTSFSLSMGMRRPNSTTDSSMVLRAWSSSTEKGVGAPGEEVMEASDAERRLAGAWERGDTELLRRRDEWAMTESPEAAV